MPRRRSARSYDAGASRRSAVDTHCNDAGKSTPTTLVIPFWSKYRILPDKPHQVTPQKSRCALIFSTQDPRGALRWLGRHLLQRRRELYANHASKRVFPDAQFPEEQRTDGVHQRAVCYAAQVHAHLTQDPRGALR